VHKPRFQGLSGDWNVLPWRQTFVMRVISPFWLLEFWGSSYVLGKFVYFCGNRSSIGAAQRLGFVLDGPVFWISVKVKDFSLLRNVKSGFGAHSASHLIGTGFLSRRKSGRGLNLTTHFYLVSWPRMSLATPLHVLLLCAFMVWIGKTLLFCVPIFHVLYFFECF
jgi:hypothetical protein